MSACGERLAQAQERLLAAELGIERVVVDDVVAVRAAGARLEERRGIEMADAERLQIRHDRGGVVEAEARRELQAIGRDRNRGRHHCAPMRPEHRPGREHRVRSAPPQIGRPVGATGGRLVAASSDRLASKMQPASRRRAASRAIEHVAVPARRAECCAGEARRDLACGGSSADSRTSVEPLRGPRGVSRASQSSTAERNVALRQRDRECRRPARHRPRLNSCRRPLRTASASSPWKSQKNGNGCFDPHSSPMNRSGGIGASSVIASAAASAAGHRPASLSRSPSGGCRSGRGSAEN